MSGNIAEEKVNQIRNLVEVGLSRRRVGKILRVDEHTVGKYTKDLLKRKMITKDQVTTDLKRIIRKRIRDGESKLHLAKEFGLTHYIVLSISKDLETTQGNHGIRGFTLKLLKHITQDGFYIPKTRKETVYANQSYKRLRMDFPKIRKIITPSHSIYLSEDKKEEAFKEFLNMRFNRGLTYRRYVKLRKFFGIPLTPKQKREISERG